MNAISTNWMDVNGIQTKLILDREAKEISCITKISKHADSYETKRSSIEEFRSISQRINDQYTQTITAEDFNAIANDVMHNRKNMLTPENFCSAVRQELERRTTEVVSPIFSRTSVPGSAEEKLSLLFESKNEIAPIATTPIEAKNPGLAQITQRVQFTILEANQEIIHSLTNEEAIDLNLDATWIDSKRRIADALAAQYNINFSPRDIEVLSGDSPINQPDEVRTSDVPLENFASVRIVNILSPEDCVTQVRGDGIPELVFSPEIPEGLRADFSVKGPDSLREATEKAEKLISDFRSGRTIEEHDLGETIDRLDNLLDRYQELERAQASNPYFRRVNMVLFGQLRLLAKCYEQLYGR